ncbi:Post-GPI attachment to proteins factor 3 [Tetrabaena socialis]|uniref:Post-GPI attachment to proteins factor 3 n=1 Tax=Tetrabaena socialis TaxID=47790 RepID=A0A2J8A112_9CHLO|nr:Post-GPI attachment to proteins factor 3 [Tetrabaena socialis]|eukprot:PNH06206.1 Post-GPI attachment to proteins factor 3 [Tetrabaena socialis]
MPRTQRRAREALLVVVCVLASWAHPSRASSGDRAWAFQSCLHTCTTDGCARLPHDTPRQLAVCPETCALEDAVRRGLRGPGAAGARGADGTPPAAAAVVPLSLRIFRWSCSDDCRYQYHCMHAVEAWKQTQASSAGSRPPAAVEKYYGKWPFVRLLGMQELASVLASLANLLAHALCLRRLRAEALCPPRGLPARPGAPAYPFLALWTLYGCLHMNAWLWSAVFHSRDTRPTERLDYCSAITLVAAGLLAVVVRVLWAPCHRGRLLLAAAAGAAVAAGLAWHLRYMLLVKFDYGWNMAVCVGAGVLTAVLWLAWSAWTQHPARRTLWAFLLLAHGCMLLELLDFPPLGGLLDAHAAWHVATVLLTPLFYRWLAADAAMLEGKSKRT